MIKRRIIAALLIIFLFFLPFISIIGYLAAKPTVYHNTFLAELSNKYHRLNGVEGQKVVVIGGSSVAFGLNSKQLEQSIGMPVVNFGLYASLGSKVMLDLSKNAIQPGDVVVLAFEIDEQTLSMYFNADSMWQAIDCDYTLLGQIDSHDLGKMFGGLFRYFKNKIGFLRNGAPNPDGIYNINSFDEFGDIIYVRDNNVMSVGFDPNQMIRLDDIALDQDFVNYVNEYIDYVYSIGGRICLSFCPMNDLSIEEKSPTTKEEFVEKLNNSFHASYIGEIDNYIYEAQHFYDTNFHLNDYGSFLHTQQLAIDLSNHYNLNYIEQQPPTENGEDISDGEPAQDETAGVAFEEHFLYEDYYNMGWSISGVTAKAMGCRELEIPVYHEGKKILAILPGAFEDCDALETITISRSEENALTLYDGVFSNVETLQKVILHANPDSIKVSTDGLLADASTNLYFYVEKQYFASFLTDYYWSSYATRTKTTSSE